MPSQGEGAVSAVQQLVKPEHLGIGNVFIPDKDVAGMEKETSFTATNHPRSSAI
jgi:hypothetical protein